MKRIFYFALTFAVSLGAASCSQDLDQDPPFKYPVSEVGGGNIPMPENCIMRMTFEDNLDIETSYKMEARMTGGSADYAEGKHGMCYQGGDKKAIIINLEDDAKAKIKALGSFTLTMWINFDGSNTSACTLFAIAHPTLSIANMALFLEGHGNPATVTETFFFKGYFNGKEEKWFDKGDAAKVTSGIQNKWAQMGLVYDAATSTASLYHNGVLMASGAFENFGALAFSEVSGISVGAFPSMVGLSNATTEWPASSSWFTGMMDDLYLYDKALSDTEMVGQYQDQM